ncbi:MAG TPA: zinc-dependent alcohol dehydrogenase [Steroidobacter sp.]|uniref:zinc-dependent alcohol dehydrogenase n=1 Tax=Steroidobacter sp. TaxID=1978227 RepID=UPI002ED82D23
MKAVCWQGIGKVGVEHVPEPRILNPRDAIVKVTRAAICGSDVHLYDGYVPGMLRGDILGHEFMGEVVEVGSAVSNLAVGDRVVVPFPISCGNCFFCEREMFSLCENSNPNARFAEKFWGYSPAGIFGYSHLLGGFAGGQAEYVRVPFADVGPLKIPESLNDEQVLFLGDILPTGYMAAENCNIQEGDTVAVWGCGPVGLFAIQSAKLLGATRVIGIDRFPERLRLARQAGAEPLNYDESDVLETLRDMTGGRGPDSCIDAVGMEAHMHGLQHAYDRTKQALRMETDRPGVLRQAIQACRKGGTVSVAGVYGGVVDKIPFGAVVNKALTVKAGQTHVQHYMKPLLARIESGEIDPSFIITHRVGIDDVPEAFAMFRDKQHECVKVVIQPNGH